MRRQRDGAMVNANRHPFSFSRHQSRIRVSNHVVMRLEIVNQFTPSSESWLLDCGIGIKAENTPREGQAMSLKVLVTVEFVGMYKLRRREFGVEMSKRNWVRFPSSISTNVYCVEFPDLGSDPEAIATAEADITEAAEAAGVHNWEAVCVVQDSKTAEQ